MNKALTPTEAVLLCCAVLSACCLVFWAAVFTVAIAYF